MANLLLVKDATWNTDLVNSEDQIAFIAQDTDEGKNILYTQGEYFGDSALANKVTTKTDIQVAGGPLAESVKEVYPDGIPAGSSLQDILVNLLCKELYPTVSTTEASIALNKGSITFNTVPSGFVEVGSKGTVKATPSKTTYTVNYDSTVSNLSYGYESADGYSSSKTSIISTPEVDMIGTQAFQLASSSFVDAAGNDVDDIIAGTYLNAIIGNVITKFGENKVTGTLTNQSAYFVADAISETYPLSNLGNKGNVSYSVAKIETSVSQPGSTTSSKTWTGAYPVFFNGVEYNDTNADGVEIESTSVATDIALTKCKTLNTSITKYIKFPNQAASQGWKIAIPDAYPNTTITAKAFNPTSAKYNADKTFTKGSTTGQATCGENTTFSYTLYECKGTDGENGLYVTIALN